MQTIPVMLVNDDYQDIKGNIRMMLFDSQNNEISRSELPFRVGTLSQNSYLLSLEFAQNGRIILVVYLRN